MSLDFENIEEYKEFTTSLLPFLIQEEGNATNFKKILDFITAENYRWYVDNNNLGKLLDINEITGFNLDQFAKNIGLTRKKGEDDTSFKFRILSDTKAKFSYSSIPNIVEFVRIATGDPDLLVEVFERSMEGDPANFTVKADFKSTELTRKIFEALEFLRPCGVHIHKTLVSTHRWEDMDDPVDVDGVMQDRTWGWWNENEFQW